MAALTSARAAATSGPSTESAPARVPIASRASSAAAVLQLSARKGQRGGRALHSRLGVHHHPDTAFGGSFMPAQRIRAELLAPYFSTAQYHQAYAEASATHVRAQGPRHRRGRRHQRCDRLLPQRHIRAHQRTALTDRRRDHRAHQCHLRRSPQPRHGQQDSPAGHRNRKPERTCLTRPANPPQSSSAPAQPDFSLPQPLPSSQTSKSSNGTPCPRAPNGAEAFPRHGTRTSCGAAASGPSMIFCPASPTASLPEADA